MKNLIHTFAKCGAVAALLGTMFAGCGGLSPGEYVVYQVASTEQTQSDGCYQNSIVPPDVAFDSSSFRDGFTFVLFAGPEDTYFLDADDDILEGTADGDVYSFEGESVNVEFSGPDGTGDKYESTSKTSVEITVDGSLVSGTVRTRTTERCTGTTCNPLPPDCSRTAEFVGIEVNDVKLKHDVDHGSVTPPPPPPPPPTTSSASSSSSSSSGGGGAGGGGGCLTCVDAIATGISTDPLDVCAAAQPAYQALRDCACLESCALECELSCGGTLEAACQSCISSACSTQLSACLEQ